MKSFMKTILCFVLFASIMSWKIKKIKLPKIKLPKIKLPKVKLPKIKLPKINFNNIKLPGLPNISLNKDTLKGVIEKLKDLSGPVRHKWSGLVKNFCGSKCVPHCEKKYNKKAMIASCMTICTGTCTVKGLIRG